MACTSINEKPPLEEEEKEEEKGRITFRCEEEPHVLTGEQGFGFNPLRIGDLLSTPHRTYEIVRKLGFGSGASVWLVRFHDNVAENTFLAIKVLTVNLTAGILTNQYWEQEATQTIAKANPEHPGYVPTTAMGSNLDRLRKEQPNKVFSSLVAKRIIKQVLLALDYIHTECELVHTDVQPANILVCLKASNTTISQYLASNPSETYEPQICLGLSPDPIITVKSQPLPNFGLDPSLYNIIVKLSDFGEAVPIRKIVPGLDCQPILLRAPEVILGHPWSTPVDIWAVGCIVFEFLTGSTLFKVYTYESTTISDSHLRRMIEFLGKFPEDFLQKCKNRDEYLDENGDLWRVKKMFPQPIDEGLSVYKHVLREDIAPAAAFIKKCLVFDPSVRPTASELLQDEWFSGVTD